MACTEAFATTSQLCCLLPSQTSQRRKHKPRPGASFSMKETSTLHTQAAAGISSQRSVSGRKEPEALPDAASSAAGRGLAAQPPGAARRGAPHLSSPPEREKAPLAAGQSLPAPVRSGQSPPARAACGPMAAGGAGREAGFS